VVVVVVVLVVVLVVVVLLLVLLVVCVLAISSSFSRGMGVVDGVGQPVNSVVALQQVALSSLASEQSFSISNYIQNAGTITGLYTSLPDSCWGIK
jgi:hypothetical protein